MCGADQIWGISTETLVAFTVATASFPGAFAPVSLGTFLTALAPPGLEPAADAAGQIARHFVYGLEYGATEASGAPTPSLRAVGLDVRI